MPPEDRVREVADEWLGRALGNLARAKQPKPAEAFWEDLCFDAQQAAEKAVKAVLVFKQIDFPRTHRIQELLVLLHRAGLTIPDPLWDADVLSDYAVVTRYPGRRWPVDEAEHEEAVRLAERTVQWAKGSLKAPEMET